MVRSLVVGATLLAMLLVGTTGHRAAAAAPSFVSDDFASGGLDRAPWTVVDPVGDGEVSVSGAGTADAALVLSIPAGASHDPWNSNRSLRVLQPAADTDLEVGLRWATTPTQKHQMQGVVIQQDAGNWMRFDVHSTGSALRAFVSRTVDGRSTQLLSRTISAGTEVQQKVTRSGSSWTFAYSTDGAAWSTAGTVQHALSVTAIGPFAGTSGTLPAWDARLDWFFDGTSPIDPEDGQVAVTYSVTTTVIGQGSVSRSPDAGAYPAGSTVQLTAVPAPGWSFAGWSGASNGEQPITTVTVTGPTEAVATFVAATEPPPQDPDPTGPPATSGITSDDFSSGSLLPVWTVVDPKGDGHVGFVGLGSSDARLALSVPAGAAHDPWGASNTAVRVMQSVQDGDFQVAARFTSAPSVKYQMQGLLIEQDENDWLRFDVQSTGSSVRAYAARTVGGVSQQLLARTIPSGPEVTLRVTRTGDSWAYEWSPDGVTWTTAGTVSHALTAHRIGPFAGNGGTKPAFTAEVDWFFDTSAPITPEDAVVADSYPLTTAVVGQGSVQRSPSAGSYVAGTSVQLTAVAAAGWQFSGWTGDATGLSPTTGVTMNAARTVTATFTQLPADPPDIDVWYGDEQSFGQHGRGQKWVNVLGNVSDGNGVTSLTYSLNGGAATPLRMGPDLRRLYGPGDFNVQLDYAALAPGPNTVLLRASDAVGEVSTRSVVVMAATEPSALPSTVAWGSATSPSHLAQVVDGKWSTGAGGLTIEELGYDRTVAVGDTSWTDYEVTVPVTVRGLGPGAGTPQSGVPLVGIGLHWNGHSQKGTESPYLRWWPTGAFGWYEWYGSGRFTLQGNEGYPLFRKSMVWTFGTTYVMKGRAQAEPGGVRYSYKWWVQGQPEPAAWNLSVLEDAGPTAGAVLLVAHHADATFGTVVVTGL